MQLALIFLLLFLANVIIYRLRPLGENFYIIGDGIVIFLSFLAFVSGLYAYSLHGFKSLNGKALIFLSFGLLFWFLGELTWGIYEIVLGIESPVASLADAFWILGYPFFFLGLVYICRLTSAFKKKNAIAFGFLACLILGSMLYISLPTIVKDIPVGEKISTAGYVLGDSLLLILAIYTMPALYRTKIFVPYFLIILSIICMVVADIYYMNFLEEYEVGNLIDLVWNLDYILLAVGFLYHRESIKGLLKRKL